nr:hypothetical protein [Tanacetum cinerariifolium]
MFPHTKACIVVILDAHQEEAPLMYLLEFTYVYGIPESLHPELPGPEEPIVEFSEGKVGVYTKFFEFANYRIPILQFLFDILGHYEIHLSQLSVIGAAKVSHFEIKSRILNIIPTLNLFRVFYVPSYNSGWMSFGKRPGKNTPQCYTKPLDSLKNWNNRFFWVDERIFPTVMEWRTNSPKDKMPSADSYFEADVTTWNTHCTPIQKQPKALLCLVGLSQSYFLRDDVYPTFLYDDDRVPRIPPRHGGYGRGVRILGDTSRRREITAGLCRRRPTPNKYWEGGAKDQVHDILSHEPGLEEEVATMGPCVNKKRRKKGNNKAEANAPPKVLRKDHAAFRPVQSTLGGKSLAPLGLDAGSTFATPITHDAPTAAKSVSDPDPLSYAKPQSHSKLDIAQSSRKTATGIHAGNVATTWVKGMFSAESTKSGKSTSLPSMDGSPGDHIVPPGYFSELRHMPNTDFLSQYNINLVQQVAMGSQLRLRFEKKVRLLKKATSKIAKRDQRIQAREEEIKKLDQEIKSLRAMEVEVHGLHNQTKNLETLLEAEVDMKKAAEAKNAKLAKELESLCVQFSDLQVSNNQLS